MGNAEQVGHDARHEHPKREEVAEVDTLGDKTADEHEEGVGEEIGGVQKTEIGLGFLLGLAVNLRNPRGTDTGGVDVVTVEEGIGVLDNRDGFSGEVEGAIGDEGDKEDGHLVVEGPGLF